MALKMQPSVPGDRGRTRVLTVFGMADLVESEDPVQR